MLIEPSQEQMEEFVSSDLQGGIVMVNLLKFSDEPEAYIRYQNAVKPLLEGVGGRILWSGKPRHVFIGDQTIHDWDALAAVGYPSRDAFLAMISHPDYPSARKDRAMGLARTAVLCCVPMITDL
ncbi:DUF1330 domain-containing protein [Streptomyces sp. NPDC048419]|uniref:DUF1330 domain-containing protein n=1 Tax=Streptomyces sp. NPDC048419 TaxID=3365547 RepID=UPI00371585E2